MTVAPARAEQAVPPPAKVSCEAPAELTRIEYSLPRIQRRLATKDAIKIVAIGSSSTYGAGASSPAMSYPSQLEADLHALYRGVKITVLNRGINGEIARDMLARFDNDVIAENPDLVVWQVGSNSVLKQLPITPAKAVLRQGIAKIKAIGADVILMNPQYAPKVISKPNIDRMVDLINATAGEEHVSLFQRFAIMRYWRLTRDVPFSVFLSPDELHLNDWGYACVAQHLADAIAEVVQRPTITAGAVNARR